MKKIRWDPNRMQPGLRVHYKRQNSTKGALPHVGLR